MAKKAFLVGANTQGLIYAENDVALMKKALSEHGYDVVVPPSLSRGTIVDSFIDFVDHATETDTVIFYFSGHGHTPKGRLLLVLGDELHLAKNFIPAHDFIDALESCAAKNKLIILDCCRAGAANRDWAYEPPDSYRMLTASGRLEKGKEIDQLQASFLTYYLHEALVSKGHEIADKTGIIRLNGLYEWLKERAKQYNAQKYAQQVPLPDLLGGQKADFEIGVVKQTQRSLLPSNQTSLAIRDNQLLEAYLDWLVKQHATLELRGIREAGETPTISLERVFVALKADISAPFERIASHSLMEQELVDLTSRWQTTELSSEERRVMRWQFLARSPIMPSMALQRHSAANQQEQCGSISLGEAFRRYRWLVILGDPGSGKTTLARWITYKLANAFLKNEERLIVPAEQADSNALPEDIGSEGELDDTTEHSAADNSPSRASSTDLGPVRLPVLVRISDYAEARRENSTLLLVDYLGHHPWQGIVPTYSSKAPEQRGGKLPAEQLNLLIKSALLVGRAVIILDGLDEIAEANTRDDIVRAVQDFIRDWIHDSVNCSPFDMIAGGWSLGADDFPAKSGGNQLIITSRVAGYHIAPLNGRITHLTIEPMSDSAINRFCDAWSLAVQQSIPGENESEVEVASRAALEAASLKSAIHDKNRPGVRELATNPLLLAIIAQIHHNTPDGLPEKRVLLYHVAVKNLVEVWRETALTEEEVVYVLAPLAAYIHDNVPTGLIDVSEVRQSVSRQLAIYRGVDPENPPPAFQLVVNTFLDILRKDVGLLAAKAEYLYGFLHLTFQEYFAARYLVRDPRNAKSEILRYINNPRWREPIFFALSYASWVLKPEERERLLNELLEADNPLADLLPQSTLLIAAALPELVNVPRGIVARITTHLLAVYADQDGVGQYDMLRTRVEETINHLHSGTSASSVDRVLEEALENALQHPAHANASAKLILKYKWFTPHIAELLLDCTIVDNDSWEWPIDQALEEITRQNWQLLPGNKLELRTNLMPNPVWQRYPKEHPSLLWQHYLKEHPSFIKVIFAIYGGYDENGLFQVERIRRDSPLTSLFTEMIQEGLDISTLVPRLRELVLHSDNALSRADAALALVALSEDITSEMKEKFVVEPEQAKKILARINRVSASLFQMSSAPGYAFLQIVGALIPVVEPSERYTLLKQSITYASWRLEYESNFYFIIEFVEQFHDYLLPHHDLLAQLRILGYTLPIFSQGAFHRELQWPRYAFLSALVPILPDNYFYTEWEYYLRLIQAIQYNIDFDAWMNILRAVVVRLQAVPELISRTTEVVNVFPLIDWRGYNIRLPCLEILHPVLSYNELERVLDGIEIQVSAFTRITEGLSVVPYMKRNPELFARTISMVLAVLSDGPPSGLEIETQSGSLSTSRSGSLYKGWWSLSSYGKDLYIQAVTSPEAVESVMIGLRDKVLYYPPPEIKEFAERFDADQQRLAVSKSFALLAKLDNWHLFMLAVAATAPYVPEDIQKDLFMQALRQANEHLDTSIMSEWAQEIARALVEFAKYIAPYEDLVELALQLTKKLPHERQFFGYPLAEALGALKKCLAQHPFLLEQAVDFVEGLPEANRSEWPHREEEASMPRIEAIMVLADEYPMQRLESALQQSLQSIELLPIEEPDFSEVVLTRGRALQILSSHLTPYPHLLEKALAIAVSLPNETSEFARVGNITQIGVIASLLPGLKTYPQLENRILDHLDEYKGEKYYVQALSAFAAQLAQDPRYQEHAIKALEGWKEWIELGNNLAVLAAQIGPPKYSNSQWTALLEAARQVEVMDVIQASAINRTRYLTSDAVVSLDQLLRLGQIDVVKTLFPAVSHPDREDVPTILAWQEYEDLTIVRYAALLLAEGGYITAQILTHLAEILKSDDDRMRYRAAQSISSRREKYNRYSPEKLHVSDIGSDSVMKLAELLLTYSATPRIATVLEYALAEIIHDSTSALEGWIHSVATSRPDSQLAAAILVRIHSTTPDVRHLLLQTLTECSQALQEILLQSLTSILQSNQDDTLRQEVHSFLRKLLASDDPQRKLYAIQLIDLLNKPTSSDLEAVLKCAVEEIPPELSPMVIGIYGRLIVKMGQEYQKQGIQELEPLLQKHAAIAEAASGSLIRLWVSEHVRKYEYSYGDEKEREKVENRGKIFDRLASSLGMKQEQEHELSRMLIALLFAGQDQDTWGEYHKELVEIIELVVEREPSLIEALFELFQNAVKDGEWAARRIILAALAIVAEKMPATLARQVDQERLTRLLLAVAKDSNVDVRCFAVQTLSLLRKTTVPVALLLQDLVRDVKEVQKAVLEACKRFREVDDNVIPMLLDGLYDASVLGAYSTTQLLATLGRSDGVSFKQRQDILMGLADAVRDKRSRREVYTLSGSYNDEIEHLGSLHQAIYKVFLQVADVVGSSTVN